MEQALQQNSLDRFMEIPKVNPFKNMEYTFSKAFSKLKKWSGDKSDKLLVEGLWTKYAKDVFRDKWRIGYATKEINGRKVYKDLAWVDVELSDPTAEDGRPRPRFHLTAQDMKDGNQTTNTQLSMFKQFFYDIWPDEEYKYSAAQMNNIIPEILGEIFEKTVEMGPKLLWIHDPDELFSGYHEIAKLADFMVFHPKHDAEGVSALFSQVKNDIKTMQHVLENKSSQDGTVKALAEKYRKDLAIYKPIFEDLKEFNQIVNKSESIAHVYDYEHKVLEECDVFDDIEL